jgi:hypothetical protein
MSHQFVGRNPIGTYPFGPWAGTMAVIVACGLCTGVEVEVRWPRSSQTIFVSSAADGFMMSLMLKDIARTRRNCGTNSQKYSSQ